MRYRLSVAGALWAGVLLSAFDAWVAAGILANARAQNDFRLVYLSARLVAGRGWPALYDFGAQQVQAAALGFNWQPYVTPPPLVVLGLPLSALPFPAAVAIWTALLVAALVAAWMIAAPGRGTEKWMHLALSLGLFPAAFAIAIGQPAPLVLLALAAAWWLMRRGRDGWAGACMAVLVLKPQLALLAPVALLAAGRWRSGLVAIGASALVAAMSALALGTTGVHSYLEGLNAASGWSLTRRFTLADVLGPAAPLAEVTVVGVTVLTAWRARHSGPEIPIAAGVAGSLLVTPYVGVQDFTLLLLSAWLVLRTRPALWMTALLALGFPVLELALAEGSLPVVLWRCALLAGLAALTEPQHQTGESDAEGGVHERLMQERIGQSAD